jgi:hypothetical protein
MGTIKPFEITVTVDMNDGDYNTKIHRITAQQWQLDAARRLLEGWPKSTGIVDTESREP